MAERQVIAAKEHFEQQARATPLVAIEEMIWNGLDAGGSMVNVRFESDRLGNVNAIEVEDSGSGIHPSFLERAFGTVGKSLKVEQKETPEGRQLHGKEGRGRLKALALGSKATWTTSYRDDGKLYAYSITIWRISIDRYNFSAPKTLKTGHTGTLLRIEGIDSGQQALLNDSTRQKLTERFALYLQEYPTTQVKFDGKKIDIAAAISESATFPILIDGEDAKVTVIEWKFKPEAKKLLLCDSRGFAWHEIKAGIQAPGFYFTAYLKTDKVRQWQRDGRFALDELDEELSTALENVKVCLRDYFRERMAAQAQDVVKQWKEDQIYPYTVEETKSPIKDAERQVFDIVAVKVNEYHDSFREGSNDAKRLTLSLFKEALENNPAAIQKILKEVFRLPKELQDDLAELLDRTSFQSIVEAAKTVTLRLDTIRAFDEILFAEDWTKRLLERTQLHRLLVHHLWVIGEEYTLDVDDDPLSEVLRKHIAILAREELCKDSDVKLISGKEGIVDLMLSRQFERGKKQHEHLILELKRPSVRLGATEIQQIQQYAFKVSKDARFSKENTIWTFVLLGNDFDEFAVNAV